MKIIDKTPLQNDQGEISFGARLQGTLKYGLSWYNDLQAQKAVIAQFERMLEKGYVLIRNFTLPGSDITIPMILMGPGGTYVISVTNVKGHFEAKGDQWNELKNGNSQPAGINLLSRVVKLSKAFQVYLQKQKIALPGTVEAVLISADPGAHIESVRPLTRVIQSDAIKQFATSVIQARPVMRNEQIYDISERIVFPRPVESAPPPLSNPEPASPFESNQPSRAQAIFNSPQTSAPLNSSDFSEEISFSFDEDAVSKSVPSATRETNPAKQGATPASKGRKVMGMTGMQFMIIAILFLAVLCILAAGIYIVVYLPPA